MGQKLALCNKSKRRKSLGSLNDQCLIQQEDFPMNFAIISKRFWAEKLSVEDVYLEINFFDQLTIKTKTILHQNSPFWSVFQKLQYQVQSQADMQKPLIIKLFDYRNKLQGQIRVPFFQLAMGSPRNCYEFNSKKKYLGKLYFEMKISQQVKLQINLQKISVQLYDIYKFFNLEDHENIRFQIYIDKNHNQKLQDYQFQQYSKSIYQKNNSQVKRHIFQWTSKNFQLNKFDNYIEESDEFNEENQSLEDEIVLNQQRNQNENFKIDIDNVENIFYTNNQQRESICTNPDKKFNKLLSQGFSMEFTQDQKQENQFVNMQFKLQVKDFHDSHIVLKIYNPKTNNYFATGYIPIDQFFLHKGNLIYKNLEFLNFKHVNIWKYGHFIGQADIFVELNYPCFLRQNKIGIQTEEKVEFENVYSERKVSDNKFVKNINFYNEEIQELIYSVNQQIESNMSYEEIQPNKFALKFADDLNEMIEKPSQNFQKENDVYQYQVSVIELTIVLIKFYKEIELEKSAKIKTIYSIQKLMDIEQLNQGLLQKSEPKEIKIFYEKAGQKKLNEQNFFTNQSIVKYNEKKKVQLEYLRLFEKILHFIYSKIHVEEHDYQEMEIISFFLVHFYVKLKTFQDQFIMQIEIVLKNQGVLFQNYSFSGYQVQSENQENQNSNFFYMLIKADESNKKLNYFNDQLKKREMYEILTVKQIYLTNLFITKLLKKFYQQILKQKITWNNLPGYNTIVHFVFFQVHNQQNILKMEEQNLLDTVQAVMLNNLQLHIFLPLIITKTNINDSNQVKTLFEIMANKFNTLIQQRTFKKLNLEFNLLLQMCITILQRDCLLATEYSLLFLYKFIWLFGDNFKSSFWEDIETKIFYEYFLHWSFSIRKIFSYLLIFHFYYDQKFSQKIQQKIQALSKALKEYQLYKKKLKILNTKPKNFSNFKLSDKKINKKYCAYIKSSFETFQQVHQIYLAYLKDQQSTNGFHYKQQQSDIFISNNKKFDYQKLPQISAKLLKDDREFKNPKQLITNNYSK